MTGNETLDAILNLLGGISALLNIVGVALLVWFKTQYKRIIAEHQHRLDLKFAEHEALLKAKYETEIAILTNKLQQTQAENQLVFSNLYAKREEVLRNLYPDLRIALDACVETTLSTSTSEQMERARRLMREMHTKLEAVSIYFTDEFCKQWHKAVDDVATAITMLEHARGSQTSNWQEDRKMGVRAFEQCITAFRNITGELRAEIRKMIGIK